MATRQACIDGTATMPRRFECERVDTCTQASSCLTRDLDLSYDDIGDAAKTQLLSAIQTLNSLYDDPEARDIAFGQQKRA